MNDFAWEPILAHYGIKTRYIDLVDSIPIALWFSICNLKNQDYEVRSNDDEFGYLFIYGIDVDEKKTEGITDGSTQRLVNLREAFPPYALRPHVQHAYSLCDKRLLSETPKQNLLGKLNIYMNYNKFLFVIIKIQKENAFNWLFWGKNAISDHLSFETLIPSPEQDAIFKELLNDPFQSPLFSVENIHEIPSEEMKIKIVQYWERLGLIEPYKYATNLESLLVDQTVRLLIGNIEQNS